MRFLLLVFLSVLVSCNPSTSSSKKSDPDRPDRPNRPSKPQLQEYVTEVREVDLLDIAMDVPVEVTGNKIIFKESSANSANGVRSTCNMGVTAGEAYNFQVTGSSLVIKTSAGQKLNFQRVSGDGDSIVGSWSGKFYEGSQLVMKRMTFVSQDRLIMRTHCES